MGNIRAFGNNNRVSGYSSAGKSEKAGKAAPAGAAAGAAGAASTAPVAKAGDTVTLSGVASQVGTAGTIAIPQDSTGPLAKTVHTEALSKASKQLSPEARHDKSCEHMADTLYQEFEKMFKAG